MNNLIPGRDRAVSVAWVDEPLTESFLRRHFLGREAYRRTRYIVVRHAHEVVVLRVRRSPDEQLFSPITAVEVLADPGDTAFVLAPAVDTTVPSAMVAAAAALAPHARCVVVQGRYEHVNFVCDPRPLPVRVVEVVPPEPAKLVHQVRRVLDVAEELPPIEVMPEIVDIRRLAATRPADHYLYPCRGGGVAIENAATSYLDERPPRADWCLVGCTRSAQLHRWFYGDLPPMVSSCPRELAGADPATATLTKCCLLEEGLEVDALQVTVGWGATLAEVEAGLHQLARTLEPTWSPG